MKRSLFVLATAVAASAGTTTSSLPQSEQNALTTIDTEPTPAQIDTAFSQAGSDAAAGLPQIAATATYNAGIRLRAIHALVHYCPPISATDSHCDPFSTTHVTLTDLVSTNAMAESGPDLLVLRAAIESLGTLRVSTDESLLEPFLNHNSRDVRAATALALADLCNTTAIAALRARTQFETVDQVKLAISTALRALSNPPSSCP